MQRVKVQSKTLQNDLSYMYSIYYIRNKTLTQSTLRSHHAPVISINPFNAFKASQPSRARVD